MCHEKGNKNNKMRWDGLEQKLQELEDKLDKLDKIIKYLESKE